MGGQCPGAPEVKGPERERQKQNKKNKKKRKGKKKKMKKRTERTKLFKYPEGDPHPIYPHESVYMTENTKIKHW